MAPKEQWAIPDWVKISYDKKEEWKKMSRHLTKESARKRLDEVLETAIVFYQVLDHASSFQSSVKAERNEVSEFGHCTSNSI